MILSPVKRSEDLVKNHKRQKIRRSGRSLFTFWLSAADFPSIAPYTGHPVLLCWIKIDSQTCQNIMEEKELIKMQQKWDK